MATSLLSSIASASTGPWPRAERSALHISPPLDQTLDSGEAVSPMRRFEVRTGLMELLQSLLNVLSSLLTFLVEVGHTLLPWVPLFAWIAFWLLAVNWLQLWPVLFQRGGWIGVVLIFAMVVLVWSVIAPPPDGSHHIL